MPPAPGSICPEWVPGLYPLGGGGTESHRRSRHRLKAGLWGRRGPHGVVQACLCHALPLTLARSESSLVGVAEGLDMAFVSVQGWSSFATGASKFASAAKEGVSSRPHA